MKPSLIGIYPLVLHSIFKTNDITVSVKESIMIMTQLYKHEKNIYKPTTKDTHNSVHSYSHIAWKLHGLDQRLTFCLLLLEPLTSLTGDTSFIYRLFTLLDFLVGAIETLLYLNQINDKLTKKT